MKRLQLLPVGKVDGELLRKLAPALAAFFGVECEIFRDPLDLEFAYHGERQQYHSSEILYRMQDYVTPGSFRVLGVTSCDLFIPILTFVFGEAQIGGPCALVSSHRLRQEFYGLPPDSNLVAERLLKESIHELGHTMQLTHCDDYGCVMAASHAVEWIDVKNATFCDGCRSRIFEPIS
jgi:archaemetzincin